MVDTGGFLLYHRGYKGVMILADNCANCAAAQDIAEIKKKYSDSRKEIYRRLEALENERGRTDERYKRIDERYEGLKEDIQELKAQQQKDFEELKQQQQAIMAKIDTLTQQPAKRWDTAITVSITAIITTVLNVISNLLANGMNGGTS